MNKTTHSLTVSSQFKGVRPSFLSDAYVKRVVNGFPSEIAKNIPQNITIIWAVEGYVRDLNRSYRGKDKSTDVLTFTVDENSVEIYLCKQVLEKQAEKNGWTTKEEVVFALVHGLLHAAGYHHEYDKTDAECMCALQDGIFRSIVW